MKKVVKKVSLAMALVTGVTLSAPAIAQVDVHAAGTSSCTTVAEYLQIPNFKATASVGEEYTFPTHVGFGNVNTDDVAITLKDPRGKNVAIVNNKFTPSIQGTYVATYAVMDGTTVVASADFDIQVTGVSTDVKLLLPSNGEKFIPSKVATEKNGNEIEIQLPTALLQDSDGNFLTEAEAGVEVQVLVTATNGAAVEFAAATKTLTIDKTIAEKATYKISYEARTPSGKLVAKHNAEIVAQKNYSTPDYTYDYAYGDSTATKPTTAEIGVEKVLPGVIAKSTKDQSEIKVHYTVKVEHKGVTYTTETPNKVLKQNEKGEYVFTAHDKGNYVVTYDVEDFTGKKPSLASTSFTISNVSDNTKPTPIVTLPYDAAEGTDVNAIEAFDEVWGDSDIMILPIYGIDAANGFVENNLTMHRQIINNSTQQVVFDEAKFGPNNQYANKALVFNPSSNNLSVRAITLNGENVSIQPTDMVAISAYEGNSNFQLADGTYTVKYFVKDKLSGIVENSISMTLKIDGNYDATSVTKAPVVKFATSTVIPTSINPEEVVKFAAPTASQEQDGSFFDSQLSTFVTYKVSADQTVWNDYTETNLIAFDKDKKEYTLTVPSLQTINTAGFKYIKVIANSINNAGVLGTAEKVIKVIGTGDETATTIQTASTDASMTQGEVGNEITLPTVVYQDDLPQHVNVQVLIEDKDGNPYTAQNMDYTLAQTTMTVSNAYFVPETDGAYTITYISSDANNNKTVLTFELLVDPNPETFESNFINLPSTISGGVAELGERINLPDVDVFVSNTDYLEAGPLTLSVDGSTNYNTDNKTYIQFNQVGNYSLQFSCDIFYKADIGSHSAGELFMPLESKVYNINVSDTKGPQVLNMLEMEEAFYNFNKDGSLDVDDVVTLPLPEATDIVWEDSVLAVVGSGVTYDTIKLDAEGIEKITETGIKLTKNAVYQFIYTLYDANGNSTLLDAFTVDVGDVEPPELNVAEGVVAKSYGLNDTVVVDMSKITANDNQDGQDLIYQDNQAGGVYKLKAGTLKITLKNNTTAKVYNSDKEYLPDNLKFEFSNLEAGEYTLVVSLTDSSTKQATNTEITFTVSDAASETVAAEEVLGVVLIVVSVIMLGGVITYFVVTRKKYNKF